MIEAHGLTRDFPARGGLLRREAIRALRGVELSINDGSGASVIGESGCGKTTLGRILCGLEEFDAGEIVIGGQAVSALHPRQRARHFRRIQMIHQDPYAALNPAHTIEHILKDPLRLRARQLGQSASWIRHQRDALLDLVGLEPGYVLPRYPHMLSGGMRQRVVIARALTVDPVMLIADEAVSMIDVSLRLGILRLLSDLRERMGLSVLLITHDIATARYLGPDTEIYVMYRGSVVEHGSTEAVIAQPAHPYTQCLLSAIPVLRGIEQPGPGRLAPLGPLDERTEPPGCLFEPRCPSAAPDCRTEMPPLHQDEECDREHACLHPARRAVIPVPRCVPGQGDDRTWAAADRAARRPRLDPDVRPAPGQRPCSTL